MRFLYLLSFYLFSLSIYLSLNITITLPPPPPPPPPSPSPKGHQPISRQKTSLTIAIIPCIAIHFLFVSLEGRTNENPEHETNRKESESERDKGGRKKKSNAKWHEKERKVIFLSMYWSSNKEIQGFFSFTFVTAVSEYNFPAKNCHRPSVPRCSLIGTPLALPWTSHTQQEPRPSP